MRYHSLLFNSDSMRCSIANTYIVKKDAMPGPFALSYINLVVMYGTFCPIYIHVVYCFLPKLLKLTSRAKLDLNMDLTIIFGVGRGRRQMFGHLFHDGRGSFLLGLSGGGGIGIGISSISAIFFIFRASLPLAK